VQPTSIYVDTYGTAKVNMTDGEIARIVASLFDMRPFAIEERLKLRNPIYLETAAYGHMGKEPRTVAKVFESPYNGRIKREVELFTWEKLDMVELVQEAFGL
jgi:S-adenosylmethionine synthetase